ncbi:hypothetical protein [Streptomyces cavernicola]|uniref:Uncharacterized protein n=1 Tax=Streptomyces cavernicola TaxID=3043613 RepID=A0ABT6S593_9ACTN|nr:hypothetical protein [Streptomyces sp. B-S-A6]MDI3403243.1 hypothetical protein [Streptomyces sp. B-S-A6]
MRARRLFVTAAGTGIMAFAVAGTAVAQPTGASSQDRLTRTAKEVRPMGDGCTFWWCGTVGNEANTRVKICESWGRDGTNQAYQKKAACKSGRTSYVKPGQTRGMDTNEDLDALYVPKGKTFKGSYVCTFGGSKGKMTWTHKKSGWWKFGTDCEVLIRSIS